MANPASNYPNLAGLSAAVLAYNSPGNGIVENLIQTFLVTETEVTYNPMAAALIDASNNFAVGADSSLRLLLSISDGTVAFDSSRGAATNTWTNYITGTGGSINSSNHNTRPEIMVAVLGNTGVGLSERYSRSVQRFQKYQANRFGSSTQANAGTFRVSMNSTL
jgi:hypothetical protein